MAPPLPGLPRCRRGRLVVALPRGVVLFRPQGLHFSLQHQQGRRFRQRLVLALQLSFELLYTPASLGADSRLTRLEYRRGPLLESLSPLPQVLLRQALATKPCAELAVRQAGGFYHGSHLL